MNETHYGPDGSTVLMRLVDNGDGKGTRTTYDEHGNHRPVPTCPTCLLGADGQATLDLGASA